MDSCDFAWMSFRHFICQIVSAVLDTRSRDQKATKVLDDFINFINQEFQQKLTEDIVKNGVKSSKLVLIYKDQKAKLNGTLKGTSTFFKTSHQNLLAQTTNTLKQVGSCIIENHCKSFALALNAFSAECLESCKRAEHSKYDNLLAALRDNEALQGLANLNITDIIDDDDATEYVSRPEEILNPKP